MNPLAVQEANLKLQQEQAQTQSVNQINTERQTWVTALQQGKLQTMPDGTPNLGYNTNDLYKSGDPIIGGDGKPVMNANGQPILAGPDQAGQPRPGAQTFSDWVTKNMPQTGQTYLQTLTETTRDTNAANASALGLKSEQLQGLAGAIASANSPGAGSVDIRNAAQSWIADQDPATRAALGQSSGLILDQMDHQLGQAAKAAGSNPNMQEAARNAVVQSFVARFKALGTTADMQATQYGKPITTGTTPIVQGVGQAAIPRGGVVAPAVLPTQIITAPGTENPVVVGAGAGGKGAGQASPWTAIPPSESPDSSRNSKPNDKQRTMPHNKPILWRRIISKSYNF